MSQGKIYDLVVFGATGFTGKYVVEEVARTIGEEKDLKWAIAGRQMKALQEVLNVASKNTGHDLTELPIIMADVKSELSLLEMCKQTKVLLNCVGPYRFYGTPVVQACIEANTDHIDISGETEWLEKIQLQLDKEARSKEIFIIQSCGFDSIPAEMGILYTKQNFNGELNSIEAYIKFNHGPEGGSFNDGTWKSAVHGMSHKSNLRSVREMIYPQSLPQPKVKMPKRGMVFYNKDVGSYCFPFAGPDKANVQRTNYFNYIYRKINPVQFQPFIATTGMCNLFSWIFIGLMLTIFTKTRFGVYLLERFPRFFSLGFFTSTGPTRSQMKQSNFEMTLFAEGFSTASNEEAPIDSSTPLTESQRPDKKIVTKVVGPEPAYITTPICMVQAAYVLLKEKSKLPDRCGVLTPGQAFIDTTLIERLQKHNIIFSTVQ